MRWDKATTTYFRVVNFCAWESMQLKYDDNVAAKTVSFGFKFVGDN